MALVTLLARKVFVLTLLRFSGRLLKILLFVMEKMEKNNKMESDGAMLDITKNNEELSEGFDAIKNKGDEIREIRTAYGDKMNEKYIHKNRALFEMKNDFWKKYGVKYERVKKARNQNIKELLSQRFEK